MSAKRDPDATRAAILEAAQTLFLDKGFGRVSVNDIARAAGVTKSLIHHHFGSKEDLWTQVKEGYFAEFLEGQVNMLGEAEPSAGLLRTSMIAYFRYLQRKPDFPRLISMMRLEDDESCSDMDLRVTRAGVAKIREGQELGFIRDDLLAENILIGFLSLVENWYFSRSRFMGVFAGECDDREEQDVEPIQERYLADMLEIYFEGLKPKTP